MGKIRNQGSASLEATLVVSVFLLAMVSLFWMAQSVLAEAQVYEAAAETAEYMAEIAYLGAADTAVAYLRFPKYADEKETVERYVKHGVSGVQFLGSEIGEEYIVLRVSYAMEHLGTRSFTIRKRAYTGAAREDTETDAVRAEDAYVYVTDNQAVYHMTRRCSYLTLQIQASTLEQAKHNGYDMCAFCGKDVQGRQVYVTNEGDRYHSSLTCSGLKRTVYRKKKSEVTGLAACSRCGAGN